jgi:hypothetical protein
VIWTPRFIMLFALTLVLGLSLDSLFTQAWWIHWITGEWVFLGHIALISLCLLALLIVTHSRWLRYGALFGLIWAFFMSINVVVQSIPFSPKIPILAQVNVVTCLAFLGCYIFLSIDRLPISRWDAWLLGLTPIIGAALLVPLFFLWSNRSSIGLENSVATVAMLLSVLVWWVRPSCWKTAPGPTFLFGVAPVILLLIHVTDGGTNADNFFLAHAVLNLPANVPNVQANFFLSGVTLLSLLLGVMRLVKYEREV